MYADSGEGQLKTEADEPGWEVDPDDDWGVAVVATVGRQLKLRREAVGTRAADFGVAVGYGEDMVYKIEGGKRIPQPGYLDKVASSNCGMAPSGRRLSHHGSHSPSSNNCWEKHDPQGLRKGRLRTGVVQKQL